MIPRKLIELTESVSSTHCVEQFALQQLLHFDLGKGQFSLKLYVHLQRFT